MLFRSNPDPHRLDVRAFAEAGATLEGEIRGGVVVGRSRACQHRQHEPAGIAVVDQRVRPLGRSWRGLVGASHVALERTATSASFRCAASAAAGAQRTPRSNVPGRAPVSRPCRRVMTPLTTVAS